MENVADQQPQVRGSSDWLLGDAEQELPDHVDVAEQQFQKLKSTIHEELVVSLDLSRIGTMERKQLWRHVRRLAEKTCGNCSELLSSLDRERLLTELMDEIFGVGPLQKLVEDAEVTDILVNDAYTVYVERRGRLELTDVIFADRAHLVRIIQRIVSRLGRRIDEVSPMVDARLPDGSRVNAIVPPVALDGPSMSIRRFGRKPLTLDDLLRLGSIHPDIVKFLEAAVEARIGCVISGGTGAGKTTLLNIASTFIPFQERIVTIEDSAELLLRTPHLVRMETRPPNTEGAGELTQRDLVRNSLRMRPDRIIVGEVRGPEVWDMLQAMNTGHEGSLTTVHANSAEDALARLEMMATLTGYNLPVDVIRKYIAAGIKLIVHAARLKGGPRRVMQVSEIVGIQGGDYELREIFGFEQQGINQEGFAVGEFYATGQRPAMLTRLRAAGIDLADELFEKRRMPDNSASQAAEAGFSEYNGNGSTRLGK